MSSEGALGVALGALALSVSIARLARRAVVSSRVSRLVRQCEQVGGGLQQRRQ